MSRRTPATEVHPYLRLSFWLRSENQFWNSPLYRPEVRKYFYNSIRTWAGRQLHSKITGHIPRP
jgi:hypothetical protein